MQSGPGSLVSAFLSTSLSPVCGLEVFTTPVPQPIWSTREQRPPRMFTKKVGTRKPGWSQQPCVPRGTQPFGLPATSQPGMPAQDAFAFPHGTHAACSQRGKPSAAATVKVVCTPVGGVLAAAWVVVAVAPTVGVGGGASVVVVVAPPVVVVVAPAVVVVVAPAVVVVVAPTVVVVVAPTVVVVVAPTVVVVVA